MQYGTGVIERPSRLGLTPEAICAAGFELVEEGGLGALTMQRVAQKLGVGTMTLYGHFRDKEALLEGVIEYAGTRAALPETSGPWRTQLRELMLAFRGYLRAYPFVIELRLTRRLTSPQALRWTEAALTILEEAGLPRDRAARAYRLLFVYTFGDAAFGPASRSESATPARGAAGEPSLPHVAAAAAELAEAFAGEASYEAGLDDLLDLIAAQAADRRS